MHDADVTVDRTLRMQARKRALDVHEAGHVGSAHDVGARLDDSRALLLDDLEMCIRDSACSYLIPAGSPADDVFIEGICYVCGQWFVRLMPVSYTHLDVYKRQI